MTPEEMMLKEPDYTLYTRNGCVWCEKLSALMQELGLDFEEVYVDHSVDNLAELRARYPEAKTVPQLFKGDTRIGGFEESRVWFEGEDFKHASVS
jgi:glutaredoxin 3